MTPETLKTLVENYECYGFYTFMGDIVCSKLKTLEKYFISARGCSCKGYLSHGHCKHRNMLNGVWTPQEGTKSWYESQFEGILPMVELPEEEMFNTVFVTDSLPHKYKVLCITVKYEKYSMGVTVFDPSFDKEEFNKILCQESSLD